MLYFMPDLVQNSIKKVLFIFLPLCNCFVVYICFTVMARVCVGVCLRRMRKREGRGIAFGLLGFQIIISFVIYFF